MTHVIEVLTFDGCPNGPAAVELVRRVAGGTSDVRVVDVPDAAAAERLRFLGSPTIRVDGTDIEPGADTRTDFVLACRIYRTGAGTSGQPDERWLQDALAG